MRVVTHHLAPSLARILCVLVLVPACAMTPAVSVVRRSPGDKVEDIRGDRVKVKRGPQEPYAGARGGFFVVRGRDDWEQAWPTGKAPAMPPALDTSEQMLILAVADDRDTSRMKVERVLETATSINVLVRETKAGEGCLNKQRALDAVVAVRTDKPVKFVVEEERGESCGEPPAASVECRVASEQVWSTKVTAQPGDIIECTSTAAVRGSFAVIDRVLSMTDLPPGSTAKLAFKSGPDRGELEIDVYGKYTVVAEAVDEAGRHGKASASIEVMPPKTKDVLVQLVWAGFDRADVSDSFPRVDLRVAEEGAEGRRCTKDLPVDGLCDVKTRGAYTYMRVPEGSRKLPVSVQFLDERAEKGPGPCIHVWYDGARTGETCDRKHRDAGEVWNVGALDTATGKIDTEAAVTPPPAADSGAAAAGKKPSPKKPKVPTKK